MPNHQFSKYVYLEKLRLAYRHVAIASYHNTIYEYNSTVSFVSFLDKAIVYLLYTDDSSLLGNAMQ